MQVATGANMLNFGYWEGNIVSPVEAQSNLCTFVGRFADLDSSRTVIDVGSGFGEPALQWIREYRLRNIICVNINYQQLVNGLKISSIKTDEERVLNNGDSISDITCVNSTSLSLPLASGTVDRIIALESAQHFKPLDRFIEESYRILQPKGLLVIAIPVTVPFHNVLIKLFKLGILNMTWTSEHYELEYVKSAIRRHKFKIMNVTTIGTKVYEPLALYYIQHRKELREKIMTHYPSYIEKILSISLAKMMDVSKKGLIDYLILKAQKI